MIYGKYYKYHGAGNDYIVIPADELNCNIDKKNCMRICDRHLGIGSDGILLAFVNKESGTVGQEGHIPEIVIMNPDGSIAEKSGNGLRIFARYLWEKGFAQTNPFSIKTASGTVTATVKDNGKKISVSMGQISFIGEDIPVCGFDNGEEIINKTLNVKNTKLTFSAANIGNPHCVILHDKVSEDMIKAIGYDIETLEIFPNRINVQLMEIIDRHNIRIEIWERGAGYTLSSGTSSCAAAAVAKKLKLCDSPVKVHTRGGVIDIIIDDDWHIDMSGPVIKVCEGRFYKEMFLNS